MIARSKGQWFEACSFLLLYHVVSLILMAHSIKWIGHMYGFTSLIYHFIYCEHIEVLLLGTYPSLVWPTIGVDPRGGYSVILGEGVPLGLWAPYPIARAIPLPYSRPSSLALCPYPRLAKCHLLVFFFINDTLFQNKTYWFWCPILDKSAWKPHFTAHTHIAHIWVYLPTRSYQD